MKNYTYFFVLICICFAGCKKNYNGQNQPYIHSIKKVTAQKLQLNHKPNTIVGTGILGSDSETKLSFKTGGIIKKTFVSEGDFVPKGHLLAELDLQEIEAKVHQAQVTYEKASRDLHRMENLFLDSAATLEQKQNALSAVEIAKANLKTAQFNLHHSRIFAPVSGKIIKRSIEEGELISPGQTAFYLASAGNKGSQIVNLGLADKDVTRIALNDSADIVFDFIPGKTFSARVTKIAESANQYTGTFSIELALDKYHPGLKNGFVADVTIYPTIVNPMYKIPMKALLEGNGKMARIFTSENGKTVQSKQLKVSEIHNDYFLITKDQITSPIWLILDGASYLSENDSIVIINHGL